MAGETSNDQAALSLAQLARNEFVQGNWVGAEKHIRRSIFLNPRFAPAYDLLSSLLEQAGQFDESNAVAREGLAATPGSGPLYYHLVRSHSTSDQDMPLVSEIEDVLRAGAPEAQDSRYLHYALGKAFDDLGEYEKAMEHWDAANAISQQLHFDGQTFDRKRYGAFFDSLCSLCTSDFFRKNAAVASDSNLPIQIVGMIRSGTTLVEQILSSHSRIAAGGELSYWTTQAGAHLAVAKKKQPVPLMYARRIQAEYLSILTKIAPDALRITDKMPDNYVVLGWIHALFPKTKTIHVRRNAADNCLSIYATPYSAPPLFAYSKGNIAFAYERYLNLMDHWRSTLPAGSVLDINYEDIVLDTEQTARAIIEFCGLPWEEACLSPEGNQRIVRTPSVWQVRQPVYGGSVRKWKRYEPWLGPILALRSG